MSRFLLTCVTHKSPSFNIFMHILRCSSLYNFKLCETFKSFNAKLEHIAFLMPSDVHRLMESEAEEINATIICNRKSYADLIATLHKGWERYIFNLCMNYGTVLLVTICLFYCVILTKSIAAKMSSNWKENITMFGRND